MYIHSVYTYCIYTMYIQYVYTLCIYILYIHYVYTVCIYTMYIHTVYTAMLNHKCIIIEHCVAMYMYVHVYTVIPTCM